MTARNFMFTNFADSGRHIICRILQNNVYVIELAPRDAELQNEVLRAALSRIVWF